MDNQRDFISEAVDTGAFIWALTCDSPAALAHKKLLGAARYYSAQFMILVQDFEKDLGRVRWLPLMQEARKHINAGTDASFVDMAENEHLDVTRRLLALEAAQLGMPDPIPRLLAIEKGAKNYTPDLADRRFRIASKKMIDWRYLQEFAPVVATCTLH
jgi:hypothetical protein